MNRPLAFVVLFAFFWMQPASAATLYFDPAISELERGGAEVISVRLDTDEAQSECVNVVEGVLDLTGPIKVVDTSLGESIFSIWVESPTISSDGSQITFAGGIPNGYCGRIEGDPRLTNNIFNIVVRADADLPPDGEVEAAAIAFTNQTQAYLNDGSGTKARLLLMDKQISVLPQLSTNPSDVWSDSVAQDNIRPQEFSIVLVQEDLIHNGRYYITFNTTDKQSGIDHYEVMEEPLSQFGSFTWGRADAPWVIASHNQYVLKDQNLNSIIRVKAVDKAGNEYVATYLPDETLRTTPLTHVALLVLLVISFLVLLYGVWAYNQKRRQLAEEKALEQAFGFAAPAAEPEPEVETEPVDREDYLDQPDDTEEVTPQNNYDNRN